MSVVIGYVTDSFSVIITDTRITYGKNAEYGWDDNYEKLVSIPNMGWATGVGVFDVIDKFNKNLAKTKIGTIKNIEELYLKTLEKEKREQECLKDHIDSTVITCSWVDINTLRVGLLNKEFFGENLVELIQNQITILYPFDYLEDERKVADIQKRYCLNNKYSNFEKLLEHLLLIFADISANSFGVSNICDIGIQLFLKNSIYKLNLKEDVRPLIQASKDGTIMNMLSVVS
jgi:hypothetical protein